MRTRLTIILTMLSILQSLHAQEIADTISVSEQITECDIPADSVRFVKTCCPTYAIVRVRRNFYFVEASASLSSGESTPFWLVNNRQGLSSLKKSNGYLRGGIIKQADYDKRFDWEAGIDVAVPYRYTSHFVIQQLYGGIRYRSLNLRIGSKLWTNGVVDPYLSSGDMLLSQNSRPIPQVMLEMPKYEYVPFTKDWLAVRGYFSMGLYTDWRWERDRAGAEGSWIKNRMLHTKGLFIRGFNPDRSPITVEGGLEMAAQWGGTYHGVNRYTHEPEVVHLPHGIKDMMNVIICRSGGDASDPGQMGEITNVYGNHVGQWSLAVNWNPKNLDWKLRAYYEHFFDDHSMMFFDHAWKDMLLGVQAEFPKNPVVSKFVYEYLITKDQSGSVYWDQTPEIPSQVSGMDDYYSHTLYTGWQTWGMGQGNPLLISPIYNTPGLWNSYEFMNNRIKGHHFGFVGSPTTELDYRVLLTFTRSWGSYIYPAPSIRHNFNGLLEINYHPNRLPGWNARLGLAVDAGKLLGKSFGAMLTISKSGWL